MDTLFNLASTVSISAIAALAIYWTHRNQKESWESMIQKDLTIKQLGIKNKTITQTLPIRLQAYERLVLLLERSKSSHLLQRLSESGMPAGVLHHSLITSLRAELEHNLSQQIYVGPKAWEALVQSHESLVNLINACYQTCNESSSGLDLARQIFQQGEQAEKLNQHAINLLKSEALQLMS